MMLRIVQALILLMATTAFFAPHAPSAGIKRGGPVYNGDVEVIWPGNKKVKAKPGEALKAVAARARYTPNYGCEEGKCGSCEHKGSDGKKYRVCITKVPKIAGPLTLKP
ncbi:hypothetical protein NSK_004788 [Nannochloropsis salina CCMP1776]|jgi:ferredoxin|uniref:2Fe-2S ferredoxin-type domain-containing protein n=1 Tax=Nannochloropsis salina CCMP1776 TaxID=1027361 RepID=A0A4D9CYU4_9STRA|nr:hypothetical protein NSK_004788 [Nannochloropsis salina CCMP1776]|eukprot:TFJ83684.1 hypothetical protein NSK_004788 [Nannochloropsis salina CCMP1776]